MTCDECKALLLPLVEGDLPTAQAEEVRRIASDCPECAAELQQLERAVRMAAELPMAAPPAGLHARLMQAAEGHRESHEPAVPAAPVQGRVSESGLVRGWLHFVERFANGPQFGMATIMLLLVVGTLWVVPNLPRKPEGAGDSVATPIGSSATAGDGEALLEPAEELDLAVDMRRGRILRRGEMPQRSAPAAPATAEPMAEAEAEFEGEAAGAANRMDEGELLAAASAEQARAKVADGQGEAKGYAEPAAKGTSAKAVFEAFGAPPVVGAAEKEAAAAAPAAEAAPADEPAWKASLIEAGRLRKASEWADAVLIYEALLERKDLPPSDARSVLEAAIECHQRLGNQARVEVLRKRLAPTRKVKAKRRKAISEQDAMQQLAE